MVYDYGLKKIAHHTGLTGIEAKNIARGLKARDVDYQTVDWQTIGSDLYGHGSRSKGVKHHLRHMYGIELSQPKTAKYEGQRSHASLNELNMFFSRRSKRSKRMDLNINAKKRFKHTNVKGVKKWKKRPNQYDIIGVDDIIKF